MIPYYEQTATSHILEHIKELWKVAIAILVAELGIISFSTERLDFENCVLILVSIFLGLSLIANLATIIIGIYTQRRVILLIADTEKYHIDTKDIESKEDEIVSKNKAIKLLTKIQRWVFISGIFLFLIGIVFIVSYGNDQQDKQHKEIIYKLDSIRISIENKNIQPIVVIDSSCCKREKKCRRSYTKNLNNFNNYNINNK